MEVDDVTMSYTKVCVHGFHANTDAMHCDVTVILVIITIALAILSPMQGVLARKLKLKTLLYKMLALFIYLFECKRHKNKTTASRVSQILYQFGTVSSALLSRPSDSKVSLRATVSHW